MSQDQHSDRASSSHHHHIIIIIVIDNTTTTTTTPSSSSSSILPLFYRVTVASFSIPGEIIAEMTFADKRSNSIPTFVLTTAVVKCTLIDV